MEVYEKLLRHSVGFNPRGLKRLCNTLLLLPMVAEGDEGTADLVASDHRLALLFGLVCMESAHEGLYERVANASVQETQALLGRAGDIEDDDDDQSELTSSERAFLEEFAHIVDFDGDGRVDEDEVRGLLSMLKLAALTSVTDDPKRTAASGFPSVDELISRGMGAGHATVIGIALQLLNPLESSGVLSKRTTKGAVVYEVLQDAKRRPAIYLSPDWKGRGAVLSLRAKTLEALQTDLAPWQALIARVDAHDASFRSDSGHLLRIPLESEAWAKELFALLGKVAPFASGS